MRLTGKKQKGETQMFSYLWEFRIDVQMLEKFEEAYKPDGLWAKLFEKARVISKRSF